MHPSHLSAHKIHQWHIIGFESSDIDTNEIVSIGHWKISSRVTCFDFQKNSGQHELTSPRMPLSTLRGIYFISLATCQYATHVAAQAGSSVGLPTLSDGFGGAIELGLGQGDNPEYARWYSVLLYWIYSIWTWTCATTKLNPEGVVFWGVQKKP